MTKSIFIIVICLADRHMFISCKSLPQNLKVFQMSSFKKFSEAHTAPGKNIPGGKRNDAPTPNDVPKPDEPATQPNKALAEDMARYSITRVPVDYYHYGAFRYTSLKDAVAQAKRAVQG